MTLANVVRISSLSSLSSSPLGVTVDRLTRETPMYRVVARSLALFAELLATGDRAAPPEGGAEPGGHDVPRSFLCPITCALLEEVRRSVAVMQHATTCRNQDRL